jgi:hypothetical protein
VLIFTASKDKSEKIFNLMTDRTTTTVKKTYVVYQLNIPNKGKFVRQANTVSIQYLQKVAKGICG